MARTDPDLLRHVIRRLIEDGGDHRLAVSEIIDRRFFAWAIEFLHQINTAKRRGDDLESSHWYRDAFLTLDLPKEDVAAYGAIPLKTIGNVYGSQRREVVARAARDHYARMQGTIVELLAVHDPPAITLAGNDLTLSPTESLVIINALAVKRAQIRGGQWSSVGKQTEVPLMKTLCALFSVSNDYWRQSEPDDARHQIDFMLLRSGRPIRCEIKLMGRGNPEGFKAAMPNDAQLLVADHLSDQARTTLTKNRVQWVALAEPQGYRRFGQVLDAFNIPHSDPRPLSELDDILDEVLGKPGAESPGG